MPIAALMPKEHGATVLLAASVLLGWFPEWSLAAEVVATVMAVAGLLFLREPLVRTLRRRASIESKAGRQALVLTLVAGSVTAVSGAVVLIRIPLAELAPLLIAGATCFSISVIASVRRSAWRWWVDLAGATAAALPVPALRLATTGDPEPLLYAACLLFYLGSTFHLRTLLRDGPRMRKRERMRPWLAASFSLAATGVSAVLQSSGWLPAALALPCYVSLLRPVVMRGWVLDDYMRVGLTESGLTAIYVLVMMFAGR